MSAVVGLNIDGERTGRKRAYRLREGLRQFAWGPDKVSAARLGDCGRRPIGQIGIWNAAEAAAEGKVHAHWKGLLRCGRAAVCPTCALQICSVRADEVQAMVAHFGQERCLLLTLTMKHEAGQRLKPMIAGLIDGWRRVARGEPWKRIVAEYGLHAYVKAVECTHGNNGWHPHLHLVLVLNAEPERKQIKALERAIAARWQRMVVRELGAEHEPTEYAGCDLRELKRTDYLAKLGFEVSAPPTKKAANSNRSPWEIASALVENGLADDEELWHEWSMAMYGRHMQTWSRGLKAECGIDEQTDQEIVEQEDRDDVPIWVPEGGLPTRMWRQILHRHPELPRVLLEAAEQLGAEGVEVALDVAGFARAPPEAAA